MGNGGDHRRAIIDITAEPLLHLVKGADGGIDFQRPADIERRRAWIAAQAFCGFGEGRNRR